MNNNEENLNIGFIGFGLIGGSIARSLKNINRNFYLYAYDYHKDKSSSDLQCALDDGVLNEITKSLDYGLPDCDIVFLCAPVLANIKYLKKLKPLLKDTCILTDVGSVKSNINAAICELGMDYQFVGGHPMTGSEKTGYVNSYAMLLENAYYILSPTQNTPKKMTDLMINLVDRMGAIPMVLMPDEHDEIAAAISHVPHIIAAQLVNLIKNAGDKADIMRNLAAGGFKDITRIASSSPVMWQNICITNKYAIKMLLDRYIESLSDVSSALIQTNESYLYNIFYDSRKFRNSISNKSTGMIDKFYDFYLDITDEAGAIATVATILASNQISIKNIGIIHNREFEEGVLKIMFYDDKACEGAKLVLKRHNYRVYER